MIFPDKRGFLSPFDEIIIVSEIEEDPSERSLYDSDLLSFSLIKITISNPIKKIKKQNPRPAPVSPFVSPWTIMLKIVP